MIRVPELQGCHEFTPPVVHFAQGLSNLCVSVGVKPLPVGPRTPWVSPRAPSFVRVRC